MKKEYDLNLPVQLNRGPLNLKKLIQPEMLFRLNPHLIIENYHEKADRFKIDLEDHATEQTFEVEGTLKFLKTDEMTLTITGKNYTEIHFFHKNDRYWATVNYSEDNLTEEDEQHIVLWLRGIKEYLRLYLKTSPNTLLFRFLMNRVILKMTPSQRKISLMLIRLTVLEIVAILVIVVGYFFFMRS